MSTQSVPVLASQSAGTGISITAPRCYIGQGNVIVRSTTPTWFIARRAPLALKGLTLEGQQAAGCATDVAALYAEDVSIQGFTQGAVQVVAGAQANLKDVQFLSNEASGSQGAAIYGAAGPKLVLDTVSFAL
jgi:predicted outer membrane repeat protein